VPLSPRQPGPAERAVLDELAPTFRERFVSPGTGEGVLRILEGGAGSPLVLLHGRGSAAPVWLPVLSHLARTRRVLAVDLPGFGSSRGHRFAGGGFEAALAFFVEPVEAWLAAEGVAAPVVVGHSLGGFVALELALRRRVVPSALVLIAPMGVGAQLEHAARLFFRAGPERLARLLGPRAFARVVSFRGPDAARLTALAHELYAVPGGRAEAAAAFGALVPLTGPVPHRGERLAEIDAPALVLWGEGDEALPAPLAIAAASALRRSVLHLVPAGHAPHLEDPAGTLATLAGFLSSRA
jgi:pimeloyl-ACP methyl ester carboxylesterase